MATKKQQAKTVRAKKIELEINQLPVDKAAETLKRELPRLINDAAMLVRRPFRFVWDSSIKTASTDCLAEIRVNPRPFIEGEREVGYGSVYHETGHINYSRYGVPLITQAGLEGGEVLQTIVNIILDRKDDYLTAKEAPGFAGTLRRRLLVIRTMARREHYKHLFEGVSLQKQSQILRNFKAGDSYEDFFLAAKCGKSPRLLATKKAMKYVKLSNLIDATPEKLLWVSKKVREVLGAGIEKNKQEDPTNSNEGGSNENPGSGNKDGKSASNAKKKAEANLVKLWANSEKALQKQKVDSEILNAIKNVVKQYMGGLRANSTAELLKKFSTMGITFPGPISVGLEESVPVMKIAPDAKYATEYQKILTELQPLIDPVVRTLRNISTPSEFELYGRDEGDLDLTEVSRIAAKLGGFYMETVVERDIDAEIHLAIDCSGSTSGLKIKRAKGIATLFSEAITVLGDLCLGRVWSFNSEAICDYGRPSNSPGFVTIKGDGGNSDTHMLRVVGAELLKSPKRRKILFVLCDDGPDDMELARKITQQLIGRGIIVVHLLIGVHGTPDIYPFELLYTSMKECLEEFGTLLQTIISNIK